MVQIGGEPRPYGCDGGRGNSHDESGSYKRLPCVAVADERAAIAEGSACDLCSVSNIGKRGLGVLLQVRDELLCSLFQCSLCLGGEKEQVPAGRGRRCWANWYFFEDEVCIGARPAKRTDSGAARMLMCGPAAELVCDLDRILMPANRGIGLLDMQVGWNFLVGERKHRFEQTSHTGRARQVADIGFHRTDQEGLIRWPFLAHHSH